MVGSPPQMETTGAPQSSMAAMHCSTVSISLIVDLYSRIRPQPVQVRLQACSGSSIRTIGNRFLIMGCGCGALATSLNPDGKIRNGLPAPAFGVTCFCHSG